MLIRIILSSGFSDRIKVSSNKTIRQYGIEQMYIKCLSMTSTFGHSKQLVHVFAENAYLGLCEVYSFFYN